MRAHQGTARDTTGLSAEQTRLAPDEGAQFREDDDGHCPADEGDEGAPGDDRGVPIVIVRNAEERIERPKIMDGEIRRLVPFCYNRDKTVEQLPDLRPKSVSSLLKGLRAYGVTFINPRADERPWPPPISYHCLWIPIPRLITSYCSRRDITIRQLMSGAVRIAVALMVMAAEINVLMSVRVFEEITQTQPKTNGMFAVQTRSGLHILTGHPTKTRCWQRHYFYIKADGAAFEEPPNDRYCFFSFWEDVPKIAALCQQKWGDFDRRRIRRQRKRISKVDWSSNVPCPTSKGKRLRLPAMGKILKEYPNYSEILGARLGDEGLRSAGEAEKESNKIPSQSVEATRATSGGAESAEPGKKTKSVRKKDRHIKKPRLSPEHVRGPISEDGEGEGRSPCVPREDLDGNRSHGSVPDGVDDNQVSSAQASPRGEQGASAGAKRKRTPEECPQDPDEIHGDSVDRLVPPRRALWDGQTPPTKKPTLATSEAVHFHYNKDIPFVNDLDTCGELIRQIRGGVRKMPEVSELAFADKFLDSARADIVAMARKNLLVMEYELAIRKVVAELVKAEETIRTKDDEFEKTKKEILEKAKRVVTERNSHYCDCKRATKKAEGLEVDLESARGIIAQLEREKAEEAERQRGRWIAYGGRAFMRSRSQKLKDILVEDEAKFRKEAEDAEVEEIGDQDLSLSPFRVEPLFGFD
ncbi:hypothetical protein N665_0515s0002, partial [Sinapis alba]